MAKVLLTGGNGFIASHVLDILLEHGFQVVVTVRSNEKGRKLLQACENGFKERISYAIVKDIAQEGAFDDVIKSEPDLEFVIHTASPFHFNIQDPVKDFLNPAIKGTSGILKSLKAYSNSVKRVVVTSSSAAILNPSNHADVYDETVWGTTTWEEAIDPRLAYRASKIYAERAAWAFVQNEKPRFDLVVLNPPLVFGPPPRHLRDLTALNTSNHRIRDMVQGKAKDGLPPTGPVFLWVDVRDAAMAHVRAIEVPEAGGERFFIVAGHFSNKRVADIIRECYPELESRLPPVDADAEDMPADVYGYDNTKSRKILGIAYRGLETCIEDSVRSMMGPGLPAGDVAAEDMTLDARGYDKTKSRGILGTTYRDIKTRLEGSVRSTVKVGL